MESCKDEVQITMRSVFLVETPPEGGSNSIMNHAREEALPSFTADGPSFIPAAAEPKPEEEAKAEEPQEEPEETTQVAGLDPEMVAAGEKVFKKCKACHQVGEGAKNRSGPQLNGIFGRVMGSVDGFKYPNVFKAAAEEGRVWDEAAMAEFLTKPKGFMKGTKMSFSGLRKPADIDAVAAYLKSFGE